MGDSGYEPTLTGGGGMRKHALLIGLGLALTLFFVGGAAKFYRLPLLGQLDAMAYDYRLRLTMPQKMDDRIVILDIDEKSLKEEGRWPWSRDRVALLMDKLFDRYHIAVVGFDVVFAEKDESSGLKVLHELARNQLKGVPQYQSALNKLQPQLEYDQVFARSMQDRKVVLGYFFTGSDQVQTGNIAGALPEAVFPAGTFSGRPIGITHWDGYGANLAQLQKHAAGAGHINPLVDADGVVRRVPMIAEYKGAYYESLSLAMVRTLLGDNKLVPGYVGGEDAAYAGLELLQIQLEQGNLDIPVDNEAGTLVPYIGRRGSFNYLPVADVLHDRIPVEQLKNKIVLIGTSALGLMDLRSTPVDSVYPGVEVHANMIAGILDQNLKQRPAYVQGAEVLLLLIIGVALSLLLPLLSPAKTMLAGMGALLAMGGLNFWLWQSLNLDMPLANSLVLIAALFTLNSSYGYFIESYTKRKITGLFGQYVPAELVAKMSKNPEQVSMEGESREMTILFSDVRGFTTISEGLDPKELSLLMNEFLTPLSRVIYKHHGTIDKYMGDCIMAFWGAPLHDPAHARNALLAGIEMQQTLRTLQPHFKARGWPEINVGVGINTGRVSVGNMGSEIRVAYTVMGDAVNLASRIEGITKQYGAGIIVGEDTRKAVPDFVYRELDQVRVKGKDTPVTIYEPLGFEGEVSAELKEEVKMFHEAQHSYRKQEWDKAELQLHRLQSRAPDAKLYQVYAERIAYLRDHPPSAEWDGVFVFESK
jgi:adenylate cyclase